MPSAKQVARDLSILVSMIVLLTGISSVSNGQTPGSKGTMRSDQYVIVLKDGTRLQAQGPYRIQGSVALFIPSGSHRLTSVPIESLDQKATIEANRPKATSSRTSSVNAVVPRVTPYSVPGGRLSMLPDARTPIPCDGLAIFMKALGRSLDEFKEATNLASVTSRIALSLPVSRMQAIERAAEEITGPHCVKQLYVQTIVGMKMEIRAYLEFMEGSQVGFAAAHQRAIEAFNNAMTESQRLQYEYGR